MAVPFAETINVVIKSKPTNAKPNKKINLETGLPYEQTSTETTIQGSIQTADEKDTARMQLKPEGHTASAFMKVYSEDVLGLGDVIHYNKGGFKLVMTIIDVDIFQFSKDSLNHYCYYCAGSLTNA